MSNSRNWPEVAPERGDMFDLASTERLLSLLTPHLPRLVGAYHTPYGFTFVFEWFDGGRFAAVEPLGVVVRVPSSRGVLRGPHAS